MFAALTNIKTQLVTVIALNGQRDKHSETFWISLQMKPCGMTASSKLGKLQPRTDISTFKHSSIMKTLRMSINAVSLEPKQSVELIQCAHGRKKLKLTIRVEEECTVATCQISSQLKRRKDLQKRQRKPLDKKHKG